MSESYIDKLATWIDRAKDTAINRALVLDHAENPGAILPDIGPPSLFGLEALAIMRHLGW